MRSTLIALFFLTLTSSFYAQSTKEQKLMDKMCKEACEEINKTDFTNKTDKKDLEMGLGLALLPVFNKNAKEIKSVYKLDVTDPTDAGKVGEKLGAELVFKCDKFKDVALKMMQMPADGQSTTGSGSNQNAATGTIDKIECGDLCVVYFKTQSDETIRLYWMEKFNGAEKLENFDSSNKTQSYTVSYEEKTVYQAKSKSYQTIKVLTGIE